MATAWRRVSVRLMRRVYLERSVKVPGSGGPASSPVTAYKHRLFLASLLTAARLTFIGPRRKSPIYIGFAPAPWERPWLPAGVIGARPVAQAQACVSWRSALNARHSVEPLVAGVHGFRRGFPRRGFIKWLVSPRRSGRVHVDVSGGPAASRR